MKEDCWTKTHDKSAWSCSDRARPLSFEGVTQLIAPTIVTDHKLASLKPFSSGLTVQYIQSYSTEGCMVTLW